MHWQTRIAAVLTGVLGLAGSAVAENLAPTTVDVSFVGQKATLLPTECERGQDGLTNEDATLLWLSCNKSDSKSRYLRIWLRSNGIVADEAIIQWPNKIHIDQITWSSAGECYLKGKELPQFDSPSPIKNPIYALGAWYAQPDGMLDMKIIVVAFRIDSQSMKIRPVNIKDVTCTSPGGD